jgi:hypothetical protein
MAAMPESDRLKWGLANLEQTNEELGKLIKEIRSALTSWNKGAEVLLWKFFVKGEELTSLEGWLIIGEAFGIGMILVALARIALKQF